MKKIYISALLSFIHFFLSAQTEFITTWKTDNPGVSADNQITIPTFPGETYNYSVEWGDGSSDTNVTGDITHTYATPGTYTISISGGFPQIYFVNQGDKEKILFINQWGTISWSSMLNAFNGCSNLDVVADDIPDLTNVTNTQFMFRLCDNLIGNMAFITWNLSSITNMDFMFREASKFNQDVSSWDVSGVVSMRGMFLDAKTFNQDIGTWNVQKVIDMERMFQGAELFNQDLVGWNTINVTNMFGMFSMASNFNGNIGSWDVSNVTNMSNMFNGALAFNQDINSWNVSNVTNMASMFAGATSFDQNLGSWDVSKVTDMTAMLFNVNLSMINYDSLLKGWGSLPVLQNNVVFDAGSSQYCESRDARQLIIDTYGWIINDAGEVPLCREDNDTDGVFDYKDDCLNTQPGVQVNVNGCDFIPNNAINVYILTPSCVGSSDGSIEITMNLPGYLLDILVESNTFSNQFADISSDAGFEIDNLPVGMYTVTVSIPEVMFEQKYGVTVNDLSSVSGKRTSLDSKSGNVSYSLIGSKSYEVSINGQKTNFRFDDSGQQTILLENLRGQNEIIISGESDCQGKITDSFFIGDIMQVFPTLTSAKVNLLTNGNELKVWIYSLDGRLVKERNYNQQEKIIDISMLESGVYFLRMSMGLQEETVKIVKK